LVTDVAEGTPAAKAGMKAGDVIVEVAGTKVASPQQLQEIVEAVPIGTSQPATVIRNGKSLVLTVTPGEQPADYGLARSGTRPFGGRRQPMKFEKLGIDAETLPPEVAKRLGVRTDHGAVITDVRPGSPAAQAGWETGMVIVQAARKPVATVEDLSKILEHQSLEKGVLFVIQTTQGTHFTVISTGE
jgi:serine protease Do